MKRTLLVSFMVGGLLVFFQNCGSSVEFSNKTGSLDEKSSSASLVPLALEDNEQDMAGAGSTSGDASGTISQGQAPVPPPAKNDDKKKEDYAVDQDSDDDSDDVEGDNDLVACILVDHGKSLKLGLIEQKFGGVNAVAQSVCISRKACLEMVSKKYDVQGAYDRGYCEHNPNVVRLTDAQVADLLK